MVTVPRLPALWPMDQLVPFHHMPKLVSDTTRGKAVTGVDVGLDTTYMVMPDKDWLQAAGLISRFSCPEAVYNTAPKLFCMGMAYCGLLPVPPLTLLGPATPCKSIQLDILVPLTTAELKLLVLTPLTVVAEAEPLYHKLRLGILLGTM